MYDSREFRSLVFRLVGFVKALTDESSSGSAQSRRFRIRPGMSEMSENCIMHSLSHLEPKNSI